MGIVFGIIAVLLAGIGLLSLSQATMGVGLIALGCLIGILGRLGQAYYQHEEMMKHLKKDKVV